MPSDQPAKKDSNLKIIALVAIFLLVALLAVLFYYQNYLSGKKTSDYSSDTTDSSQWFTYTSATHGYSISYPKDWSKVETSKATNSSGLEIVLLNLTDNESRSNGKPNIILTAGVPADYCSAIEDCKDLGSNVFAQYRANGDQATIDKVLETFKTN